MKVKPEHYASLEAVMRAGLTRVPSLQAYEARHPSIPRAALIKDPAKRHRWDALYAADTAARTPIMALIYEYANDSHIDTALRAIVKGVCK
jgi:hypothetical protein